MSEELKKLKDLSCLQEIDNGCMCGLESEGKCTNQTKLVSESALRLEAIKHIIIIRKDLCKEFGHCEHCVGLNGTIDWIKNFFNISEDELK